MFPVAVHHTATLTDKNHSRLNSVGDIIQISCASRKLCL